MTQVSSTASDTWKVLSSSRLAATSTGKVVQEVGGRTRKCSRQEVVLRLGPKTRTPPAETLCAEVCGRYLVGLFRSGSSLVNLDIGWLLGTRRVGGQTNWNPVRSVTLRQWGLAGGFGAGGWYHLLCPVSFLCLHVSGLEQSQLVRVRVLAQWN